jgi:hypothetical protein
MEGTNAFLQYLSVTTNFAVPLLFVSLIISFYLFRFNMQEPIRTEIQNSRTAHLLGMKEFLNKLTVHGMSNMAVETSIFDK